MNAACELLRKFIWLVGGTTRAEVFVASFKINSLFFLGAVLFLSLSSCGAANVRLLAALETVAAEDSDESLPLTC